jgi:hypothetical protein
MIEGVTFRGSRMTTRFLMLGRNGRRVGPGPRRPEEPFGIVKTHFIGVSADDTVQVEPWRESVRLERLNLLELNLRAPRYLLT